MPCPKFPIVRLATKIYVTELMKRTTQGSFPDATIRWGN